MVLDKFNAVRVIPKLSWWSIFGVANLFCYGLSLTMDEKDYLYYFGYQGDGRMSSLTRSLFGSNNLSNIMWTAPSLILAGQYMHNKVGPLTMLKFTPLALFSIMAF